ncbi:MAG: fatty acid degradation enzyme [Succinivibrionaceae bacterium]
MEFKKYPSIIRTTKSSKELKLLLDISSDLSWFINHYDEGFQFLPGNTLILWAEEYLRIYVAPNISVKSMDNIEFIYPIFPNTTIELIIDIEPRDGKLYFEYRDPSAISPKVMAKGQIRI